MNNTNMTVQQPMNPFAKLQNQNINAGAVEIESSRAIAEAQGKLIIAKKFPRDPRQSFDNAMIACGNKHLAELSTYSYPRAGKQVTGPSIRLAEELARVWGNIDYGIRELSQKKGESEMEAYCWDLETNTFSSQKFTVKHESHTKNGIKYLTDPREIYEICANNAGRRLRARILAVLPIDLVEAALIKCNQTLTISEKPLAERIQNVLSAFLKYNVTKDNIEKYLNKKITDISVDELPALQSIFNSIRDNVYSASQLFDIVTPQMEEKDRINKQLLPDKNELI